jgi:hypothetical protein
MAGLWNRIVDRGEFDDPLSSHLVKAAVYLAVRGVFTPVQIRDALNGTLRNPLTTAELADLNAILTNAAAGTATEKIDYLERVDALNISAEGGVLQSEAVWRAQLGLS